MNRTSEFRRPVPADRRCIAEGCDLKGQGRYHGACSSGCQPALQGLRRPPGCVPVHVPRLKTLAIVEEQRRQDCRRYEECLSYAATLNWDSFSCTSCPVDDEYSAEEVREMLMRSLVNRVAMTVHEVSA